MLHYVESQDQRVESLIRLGESVIQRSESLMRLGESLMRLGESVTQGVESLMRLGESVIQGVESLMRLGESVIQGVESLVRLRESRCIAPGLMIHPRCVKGCAGEMYRAQAHLERTHREFNFPLLLSQREKGKRTK